MQRPAVLLLAALAGCAMPHTPPPAPSDEAGRPARHSEIPGGTRKVAITSIGGAACQTNDRMPNAASGSLPSTAPMRRSESTGTPAPMPNACPVTARVGTKAAVVKYQRDSANAAPEPPR